MLGKIILMLTAITLGGCGVSNRAGVEIMSYPPAKVYIDGKEAGTTPYKNSYLKSGWIEVRLVTEKREWAKRVELVNNITTIIDREMNNDESLDGGYVLSMEKTGEVDRSGAIVNSDPSEAAVAINGEIKGFTPLKVDGLGEGDRQIKVSYPTYKSLTVFARAVGGYRLLVDVDLAKENMVAQGVNTTTPMVSDDQKEIMIKPTETGWLRVRREASNAAEEVAKVKPGETFRLLEEKGEWYRIEKGWISSKYAEKL